MSALNRCINIKDNLGCYSCKHCAECPNLKPLLMFLNFGLQKCQDWQYKPEAEREQY